MLLTNYVNPQYYENLRKFKYNGQNFSILYNWILGDMAQWVVDQLPKTVAPNLITITGFCNFLTAFALIFILNPMFDQDLPQWASLYIAWAIFVYQTLDNADGKQARRTKQSTALGMLMDHGSDCTSTWIAGLLYINAFKISFTPFNMLTAIGVSFLGFYFGVYCQQHTGVFQLGVINGVDEGLPTLQFFFVLQFFSKTFFFQIKFSLKIFWKLKINFNCNFYHVVIILAQRNLTYKCIFNSIQYNFACPYNQWMHCYNILILLSCIQEDELEYCDNFKESLITYYFNDNIHQFDLFIANQCIIKMVPHLCFNYRIAMVKNDQFMVISHHYQRNFQLIFIHLGYDFRVDYVEFDDLIFYSRWSLLF